LCKKIIDNVSRVIVGKRETIELLVVALLGDGHVLLEDVPGLGKTLMAKSLARSMGGSFKRVQFTPDLLPADVIGTVIYNQQRGEFSAKKGPIFANLVLADEINRAPAKVQSALLEAMQELQVTIGDQTYKLEPPFLVMATQNPVEQEGTYPLPEAQLDRFLIKLSLGYPRTDDEEITIMERRIRWLKDDPSEDVKPVISAEEFLSLQALAETGVYIDRSILDYIGKIVRATREHNLVEIGSSPRGALSLMKVSRCLALIHGRDYVLPDDVKTIAPDVLSHRIILRVEEIMEGTRPQQVVEEVIPNIPAPLEYARRE